MKLINEILVPGGYAKAFEADKGQLIKVTDIEGQQVADFIAFNKENPTEKISPSHTYMKILSLNICVNDEFRTDLRNSIFKVIENTAKSHDLLMPACDKNRYLVDYGVENHRNCVDNFTEVLADYNLDIKAFSRPVNFFQKTKIAEDGKLIQETGASEAGDYILLECMQDVFGAVSACPMDLNPIGGSRITDILIQIYDK